MKLRAVCLTAILLLSLTVCANAKTPLILAGAWPHDSTGTPITGDATVIAVVDVDGHVVSATIDKSSGHKALDDKALAAVRNWHFNPIKKDGVAVEGTVKVPVHLDPSEPISVQG
jgi:TonB family protein